MLLLLCVSKWFGDGGPTVIVAVCGICGILCWSIAHLGSEFGQSSFLLAALSPSGPGRIGPNASAATG